MIAPVNLRGRMLKLIERETNNAEAGRRRALPRKLIALPTSTRSTRFIARRKRA